MTRIREEEEEEVTCSNYFLASALWTMLTSYNDY